MVAINGNPKLRLLIVEKNKVCRRLLEELLSRWALPFDSVDHGEMALSRFNEQPYDLILMDPYPLDIDGFEITKQIRYIEEHEHDRNHHIPIIGITADARKSVKSKYLKAGMWEVITKPFNHHELRMLIYYYLGNVWKMRSIQQAHKWE